MTATNKLLNCKKCKKPEKPSTYKTRGVFYAQLRTIHRKWYLVLICKTCKTVEVFLLRDQKVKGGGMIYCHYQRIFKAFERGKELKFDSIALRCIKCNKFTYKYEINTEGD